LQLTNRQLKRKKHSYSNEENAEKAAERALRKLNARVVRRVTTSEKATRRKNSRQPTQKETKVATYAVSLQFPGGCSAGSVQGSSLWSSRDTLFCMVEVTHSQVSFASVFNSICI